MIWSERDAASKTLATVGDRYTIDQALKDLEAAADELAELEVSEARAILAWFQSRLHQLTESDVDRLARLALIPTELGLYPACETVRAGGFRDPLGLTSVLDQREAAGLEELIAKLGIRKLSFAGYLREHVAALDPESAPVAGLVELVHQCAKHRDAIDADPALTKLLTDLAWIPCQDGHPRPPGQVYFSSALINEVLGTSGPLVHAKIQPRTASADLLRRLGVSDIPRPGDVVARIKQIVTAAPSEQRIAQVVAVLRYLSRRAGELDHAFAPLRILPWLPAEGESVWFAPNQLYLARNRALFATTGRFLALRRTDQDQLRTTLSALGVRSSPPLELVADHVLNLTAAGKASSNDCCAGSTITPPIRRSRSWPGAHSFRPPTGALSGQIASSGIAISSSHGGPYCARARSVRWPARRACRSDRTRTPLLRPMSSSEISDALDGRQELDSATLAVVNRCWEMLFCRV